MGHVLSAPVRSQLLQRKGDKQFKVASTEMQGYRMDMEDTHTIKLNLSEKNPGFAYFGVYDGHAGDKCSAFLEQELYKRVGALSKPDDPVELSECVQAFDQEFLEREGEKTHGSTCCFAVVKRLEEGDEKMQWEVTVSNVGDSRAMIIRKDGTLISLTEDHKPSNLEEQARIQQAGGMVQMNRVDGQLAMSRAIGDYIYKTNPNLEPHEQKVTAVPDITTGVCYKDDRLLICCDGIVEAMSNEDASEFVHKVSQEVDDPAKVIYKLLEYSLEKGSKDNHSALLITFEDGTDYDSKEDDFVAGPFELWQDDPTFVKAYKEDAAKFGYEGEELMKLAKATEEQMPHLAEEKTKMEGQGGEAPAGLTGLLEAMIAQPNSEKSMMMLSMLQKGVLGGKEGEQEEQGEQGEQ